MFFGVPIHLNQDEFFGLVAFKAISGVLFRIFKFLVFIWIKYLLFGVNWIFREGKDAMGIKIFEFQWVFARLKRRIPLSVGQFDQFKLWKIELGIIQKLRGRWNQRFCNDVLFGNRKSYKFRYKDGGDPKILNFAWRNIWMAS